MSTDPYVYPGTDVLRNKLDIRDADELARVEGRMATLALAELGVEPLAGVYDLDHYRAFHRFIFGDLYQWAGQLRTVAIAKQDLYALPQHIASYGAEVFGKLAAADWLRGRDRKGFLDGLTSVIGDVYALHPFREGNSRSLRALFTQLAGDAGYVLDWSRTDQTIRTDALFASMRGVEAPLRAILADITFEAGTSRRPAQENPDEPHRAS